jgi:F-type H+-transporting ATPase subunit b
VIDVNWTLWLQFANFFVLLIALNFLLYRPLRGVIARRREEIDGSIGHARELEGVIAEKMARYQEKLQEAKLQGIKEKMALRQEAVRHETEVLAEAHRSAGNHVEAIKGKVAIEAEAASKMLRREAEALANHIASKVLGRGI